MIRKHVWTAVFCMAAGMFALQCGDDAEEKDTDTGAPEDSGNDPDGGDATDEGGEDTIKGTLVIPAEFDCAPVTFSSMFFDQPEGGTMPKAFGSSIDAPALEADGTYEFISTQAGLDGDYYMMVVVYCEGGGEGGVPVAGVDWVGASDKLVLGPGTGEVDAGDIQLIAY